MSKIGANRKVNTFHKIITPIIQDFMFDKRFGQIIANGDATCQEFHWESEAPAELGFGSAGASPSRVKSMLPLA